MQLNSPPNTPLQPTSGGAARLAEVVHSGPPLAAERQRWTDRRGPAALDGASSMVYAIFCFLVSLMGVLAGRDALRTSVLPGAHHVRAVSPKRFWSGIVMYWTSAVIWFALAVYVTARILSTTSDGLVDFVLGPRPRWLGVVLILGTVPYFTIGRRGFYAYLEREAARRQSQL